MVVRVLGDTPTVRALRLAGIDGTVTEPEAAAAAFERELSSKDLGILLVTEPVAARIRQKVEAAKLSLHFPLVLEIPAVGMPIVPADDLAAKVARMIGIRG